MMFVFGLIVGIALGYYWRVPEKVHAFIVARIAKQKRYVIDRQGNVVAVRPKYPIVNKHGYQPNEPARGRPAPHTLPPCPRPDWGRRGVQPRGTKPRPSGRTDSYAAPLHGLHNPSPLDRVES